MSAKPGEALPDLRQMPRVTRDIKRCLRFIARQPWGNASDRERGIDRGILEILRWPELNKVRVRRRRLGLELRRHNAAQFTINYAYIPPNSEFPRGMVTIRAVRHTRARNVFSGVREPSPRYCE